MIHSTTQATNMTAIKLKKNMMLLFKVYSTKIKLAERLAFTELLVKVTLLLDKVIFTFRCQKKTTL